MSSGLRHMSSKLVWVIMALLMLGLGGFALTHGCGQDGRRHVHRGQAQAARARGLAESQAQTQDDHGTTLEAHETAQRRVGQRLHANLFQEIICRGARHLDVCLRVGEGVNRVPNEPSGQQRPSNAT